LKVGIEIVFTCTAPNVLYEYSYIIKINKLVLYVISDYRKHCWLYHMRPGRICVPKHFFFFFFFFLLLLLLLLL